MHQYQFSKLEKQVFANIPIVLQAIPGEDYFQAGVTCIPLGAYDEVLIMPGCSPVAFISLTCAHVKSQSTYAEASFFPHIARAGLVCPSIIYFPPGTAKPHAGYAALYAKFWDHHFHFITGRMGAKCGNQRSNHPGAGTNFAVFNANAGNCLHN